MPPLGSKRATVYVELPRLVTHPEERAAQMVAAVEEGLLVSTTREIGRIKAGTTVPANTGALVKSLVATQPTRIGSFVEASFLSAGQPAVYSTVMDKGRTPGKRLWMGWLLYGRGSERTAEGWRTGWVNRRMGSDVERVAAALKAERGGRRDYRKEAAFLLARKVARAIVTKGITAREFFHRYYRPTPDRTRFVGQIRRDILSAMKRRGLAG